MKSRPLDLPVMTLGAICAVIVPLSAFCEPVRATVVYPMLWLMATLDVTLFLRTTFDWRVQRGFWALNVAMNGENYPFSLRWRSPFDPEWGFFGSRLGARPLAIVRVVLLVEYLLAMFWAQMFPQITLLAMAAFFLTLLATMLPAALDALANENGPNRLR